MVFSYFLITHFDIITIFKPLWRIGMKPCDWQGGFCHSADIVQLCLLLSETDYSPLWTVSLFRSLIYFVRTKSVCILLNINFLFLCVCSLEYCVFSLLAFCKPLDLSSHFILKMVHSVCDGIVSRHYSHTLRCYCIFLTFLNFK